MKNRGSGNVFKFGLIGGVGFLVDGGVLSLLTAYQVMNAYTARGFSFPLATLITWYLNRSFTFRTNKVLKTPTGEYLRYFTVQIGGSLLNLSIFVTLLHFFSWMNKLPIIPLAIGAIFGMIFNYTFSKTWVFKTVTFK